MTPAHRPVRHRCGGAHRPTLHAVHPRGRVRPGTWTHVRVDLGEDIFDAVPDLEDGGPLRIDFRVGQRLLGHVELPAERASTEVEIPPALRRAMVGLRGCVTWGHAELAAPRSTSGVWLEAPSGSERRRLDAVEVGLAGEPLWLRHTLRAQALLDAEYTAEALDEARAALALQPGEPHAVALRAHALRLLQHHGTDEFVATDRALDGVHAWLGRRPPRWKDTCRLGRPVPRAARMPAPRGGCGDAEPRARNRTSGTRPPPPR